MLEAYREEWRQLVHIDDCTARLEEPKKNEDALREAIWSICNELEE